MKTNPTMQAEAVLPTRPVSENGKINILTRLAYGGGDVACNVVYGMIATLLTLFYTDYAGVSVATVGLVMLISRFFDGGSDVVMGFIVDRTHSKWGQSRPWILWMSLPYALSAILLFSVPHTNATIQFLYIFVTYNFCTTVCYTAINLPYGSLSAMMTRDSKERDLLSVFRMGLSPMGRIIAVTCTMPLIKLFGDDQSAWIKVMSIRPQSLFCCSSPALSSARKPYTSQPARRKRFRSAAASRRWSPISISGLSCCSGCSRAPIRLLSARFCRTTASMCSITTRGCTARCIFPKPSS